MASDRYRSRPLVLRSRAVEAEEEAESCAAALGWPCRGEIPADPDQGVSYEVQGMAGPAIILHFVVDDMSGSASLSLTGDFPEVVEAATELVKSSVDFYSFEELLEEVDVAEGSLNTGRALIRSSLGAPPEYDDRLFGKVRDFLSGSDPALQEAAIWATSYTPWPEYRPLLCGFLSNPSGERLARTARVVLDAFDQYGIPGP